MPTVRKETYYTIKEDYAKRLFDKYKTYIEISKQAKIPIESIYNIYQVGLKVSTHYALKLCALENVELLVGFEPFEPLIVDRDITHIQLSEQMINGFKNNIIKRLSVTHSKLFVDEIMEVVENIIEESCYLGIECHQKHREDYILKRVFKRRKNE